MNAPLLLQRDHDLARPLPAAPVGTPDFRQMVEQADVGICITQDGLFQYVNPKFAQIHGYDATDLVGQPYTHVVHADELANVAEVRRLRDAGLHSSAFDSKNVHRDGHAFDIRCFGRVISYRGRHANLTTISDISEVSEAHRVSSWRARMLVSNEQLCHSGSIEIDLANRCLRLSEGARALSQTDDPTGRLSIGRALRLVPLEDRRRVFAQWRRAQVGKRFEFRHHLHRPDGGLTRVVHRGLVEIDAQGLLRPVAILLDITEQSAAQAQIEHLLNYDRVTGLATRDLLIKRTKAAAETALREKRTLAMLYLRVPDFERVHGALGIGAGDTLAATLAGRIASSCRIEDTCAHLGTGEFAILLDPIAGADESQALNTATRVLAALELPATVDATELFTGGRIGIALYPADGVNADKLLEHAFVACGRGGAGINFFTREAADQAARRIKLEAGLRRASERHELSLHYQPQVDLRDGSVIGAEALLRWKSEDFGAVSPAEFVPIAEDLGLIDAIGEWVFRTACEQSVTWARAGVPPIRIGINLSPRQLEQPDISQRLQSIVLETGADPTHLGIEVTESVLTRDIEHARRTLNDLSAIGIEIALDDFGTGYSNLSVLRALPFDVLKIDRSLVHDVTAATEDVSITRAVLALAQGLKIKVLAEGVETEGQLNLLISNGCELMQGYIFSKPVPPDELEALLRERRRLPERFLARAARRTLLLVDDEENVLSSLRRLLRGEGYHIVVARNGDEGLAKLAEHDVDVIVSDQRMPGMTGVEFLRRAKVLYPDTVRMVLSGYTELQSITDAVNEGAIYKFLTKPWDDDRLRAHIAEAFRTKELSDENRRLSTEVRNANLELAQANERQQQMLAQQREQLSLEECRALNAQDLLQNLPTAVIGIDDEGTIVFANRQARTLLGGSAPLVGCVASEVLAADWQAAMTSTEATHHRIAIDGRRFVLAGAAMDERGTPRGRLLSLVPDIDATEPLAA